MALTLFLIGCSLSMDAFSLALLYGMQGIRNMKWQERKKYARICSVSGVNRVCLGTGRQFV